MAHQPGKVGRMIRRIVHVTEKHILERQPPARGLPVAVGGGHHDGQANRLVDRHEPRSQVVVGRMQADGEVVARIRRRQSIDARWQADRRDGDSPLRDAEALRVLSLGQRRQQPIEVRQRLAHPHHHNVAEPLVGRQQRREPQQLLDDLAGGQVSDHAVDPTGAEDATHRAAHLRADADGAAVAVAEQHALNPLAIGELEEEFLRAVVSPLVHSDGGRPDPEVGVEVSPQIARQIGHVGERRRPAAVQPPADRRGPPGGLASLTQPDRESRGRIEHVPLLHGRGGDDVEGYGFSGHRTGVRALAGAGNAGYISAVKAS